MVKVKSIILIIFRVFIILTFIFRLYHHLNGELEVKVINGPIEQNMSGKGGIY